MIYKWSEKYKRHASDHIFRFRWKWDIKKAEKLQWKWCEMIWKGDYYQGVLQEWVKVMYLAPNS